MRLTIGVTGATGFIGRHVVARFAARGDRVRAIVRPDSPRRGPAGAEVVTAPLTADGLRTAFDAVDVVIHLAGIVASAQEANFERVNGEGTRVVADAARSAGARLVYVSSLAAAGPAPASAPRAEEDPPAPINAYGRSKLEGERAVEATRGLRWTILRPGVVYGPSDAAVLPLYRLAARGLAPLAGRPDAAYTFVFIDDAVRAIEAAVDADDHGLTCFVGHPTPVTARQLLRAICTALGRQCVVVHVPSALLWIAANAGELSERLTGRAMVLNRRRYAEMYSEGFACRVDRLRNKLGIVATVDLADGVARTAEWYRREGWLTTAGRT